MHNICTYLYRVQYDNLYITSRMLPVGKGSMNTVKTINSTDPISGHRDQEIIFEAIPCFQTWDRYHITSFQLFPKNGYLCQLHKYTEAISSSNLTTMSKIHLHNTVVIVGIIWTK